MNSRMEIIFLEYLLFFCMYLIHFKENIVDSMGIKSIKKNVRLRYFLGLGNFPVSVAEAYFERWDKR